MILFFEEQFSKDINKIADRLVKKKIEKIIISLKEVKTITRFPNIKKLTGHKTAYRIRINDYRLCFFLENNQLIITRILHRKDVYRFFP